MNIYFVAPIIYELKSAELTHTLELFNNLEKIGNNITLFIHSKSKLTDNNVQIKYILIKNKRTLWKIAGQIKMFFSLIKHTLQNGKPDVLYTRVGGLTFFPLLFSKIVNCSYIIEVNGLITDEMRIQNMPYWHIWIADKIINLHYKKSDMIVAVTRGIKKEICKSINIDKDKIVVIQNGANTDLFKPYDRKKVKQELGLEENCKYVCFVGTLVPWQGLEYLVESAPDVLKKKFNVKFLIVGDGDMKDDIVKLVVKNGVSSNFIFTGRIDYERVVKYINASDVCIAPFIEDRNKKIGLSPLKIYEYASCEKPIITSKIQGLEFIEQNNAGILVKPVDVKEIVKAIVSLLNNPKLCLTMGKNGRQYVIKNHSWESVAKKVVNVCQKALE